MKFFSPAFAHTEKIPAKYTCDGEDISPPLQWSDFPQETKSLAIICDDPDAPAGVWDHWLMFNISPETTGLEENTPKQFDPFKGVGHGLNSWRKAYYGGPCPPAVQHRYYFKIYALDTRLRIKPGSSKGELLRAMVGHVVDKAYFYGVYSPAK